MRHSPECGVSSRPLTPSYLYLFLSVTMGTQHSTSTLQSAYINTINQHSPTSHA
jgi:hypothetical protein